MDKDGIKQSIKFYLILIIIVIASMLLPDFIAVIIAYIVIILISYKLINKERDFKWGSSWKWGFFFGLILISIIFFLEFFIGWIKIESLQPDIMSILLMGVIFQILVSIGEELSFRGYILPNLIKSIGIKNGIIISSLLFAGLHIPSMLSLRMESLNIIIMMASITLAGIILAFLYLSYGLKMACSFHFAWNFFQYHVFSLRSGFGIFSISVTNPKFTGGEVGPEAGLIGFFILLLGIVSLCIWLSHEEQ